MEFLFNVLFEGVLWTVAEKLCYFFCSLALVFVPKKRRTKKIENIIKLIGLFVGLAMFVMWFIGIVLFFVDDAKSILGWIFLIVSNLYIITSLIYESKMNKSKKLKKE